ncbi:MULTISPECIES: CRISPR-associated helicase/endonuclease Cas3 [Streptomyces]|uniref:CRISPR-associated helicase/endonuclease Cas3 n=1 Tax=Streptomyces TaxID=1883 RepID=UPI0002F5BA49|nr:MULTISPECIES: CRISPR-associated helicase/endonuclease Cas3 [Streptomyces]AZK98097.1 CRISPR-associated helicase/endonuclease Cas3 [Streptomyces tsukubensis]
MGLGERLTGPVRSVWAKHDRDTEGWLPLWRHMADSAAVAGLLWDHWLPANVRKLVGDALPGGADDARLLTVWLAAVHDIGKATPAFACQVEGLAATMGQHGLTMKTRAQLRNDRLLAPHGLAGQVLLEEWLEERQGWPAKRCGQFGVVVGGHHGTPPQHGQLTDLYDRPHLLRTPGPSAGLWGRVQDELLDACADEYGVRERLDAWRSVALPQPVQVLLGSVVIVADWIASNPDLFPYFPEETRSGEERIAAAWRGLRLPPPWRAKEPEHEAQELFAARFDLPPGAAVRPVQEAAVRLAREMPVPGLMIVEAPMGEGKTEAALAVAEIFGARSGAGGLFFALPTMATGNAMFPRLLRWLDRLPHPTGVPRSVLLAHAKSALNDTYAELLRDGRQQRIAAVDMDADETDWRPSDKRRHAPAELVAHAWLRGRKKAMLSSFVAGTVDQLLFAGLKSRHLVLRHLAVAGKVVVIDEAHAYDTYMSVYLDRVLSWLGAYRVPVVVLSATLPAGRRRQLAAAYGGTAEDSYEEVAAATAYPLLTAVAPGGAPIVGRPPASSRGGHVVLEPIDDELPALADRLTAELGLDNNDKNDNDGGCVLVVRNTVRRVVETAHALRERFGADAVTVAHSCFVDLDRAAKDADLLDRFGPPETAAGRRPRGAHIVVASQVAEQSLDVDFDLLVTDLCPVDLMLQRMGRLHRHHRGEGQSERPRRLRTARCLVTGADWTAQVPAPVRGSVAVYGEYALLRSAAVLLPHLREPRRPVRLPQDISPLVQGAYGDETGALPEGWAEALESARERYEKHRADQSERASVFRLGAAERPGRSLVGWVAAGAGDADDTRAGRAQVRDSRESLEVVVVQRRADGKLVTLPWLAGGRGGLELPRDRVPVPRAARAAAGCGLRLPMAFSPAEVMDRAITELEELYVPAWQSKESPWLAGQLILALDEDCQTRLAGFSLRYSRTDGLEVTRD